MRSILLILLLFLASCGGNSSSPRTPAPTDNSRKTDFLEGEISFLFNALIPSANAAEIEIIKPEDLVDLKNAEAGVEIKSLWTQSIDTRILSLCSTEEDRCLVLVHKSSNLPLRFLKLEKIIEGGIPKYFYKLTLDFYLKHTEVYRLLVFENQDGRVVRIRSSSILGQEALTTQDIGVETTLLSSAKEALIDREMLDGASGVLARIYTKIIRFRDLLIGQASGTVFDNLTIALKNFLNYGDSLSDFQSDLASKIDLETGVYQGSLTLAASFKEMERLKFLELATPLRSSPDDIAALSQEEIEALTFRILRANRYAQYLKGEIYSIRNDAVIAMSDGPAKDAAYNSMIQDLAVVNGILSALNSNYLKIKNHPNVISFSGLAASQLNNNPLYQPGNIANNPLYNPNN